MRINPISYKKQSQLIKDYRNGNKEIMDYFDYLPFNETTFHDRVKDLRGRSFKRRQLTETLRKMNQQWDAPETTYHNIELLNQENSVVVIGGQQAGLLTGPLYTINKLISIIQLAKKQQQELQIPVIPVFWIAGEDHDFDEINHVYMPGKSTMQKHKLQHRLEQKLSVSNVTIDKELLEQWINTVFEQLQETANTKALYTCIQQCMDKSISYVDFFARIIHQIFEEEGVVLVDSAHAGLRELESDYFVSIINRQAQISDGVYRNEQALNRSGYSLSLDVQKADAHLFYQHENDRVLLVRNDTGDWMGKQNEVCLTTEELLDIARNKPELLSNNVVTRPLMQELLFPSLAFIGGPGEISYWSALKPAFQSMHIKMPPVLPRLSFTFIEQNTSKLLDKYMLTDEQAVNSGVANDRTKWLSAQSNPPIQQLAAEIKRSIDEVHQPLRDIAKGMRADLGGLADKNLHHLFNDIDYLEGRIQKALEEKYVKELREFDSLALSLHPNNGLQERAWNPLPLVNRHGINFVKELAGKSCLFTEEHYIVYI